MRTELGREIRAAFVAAPGNLFLSADYSQIELRILAHLSEDSILVEAFRRGEDIHSRTAQEVFDVAPRANPRASSRRESHQLRRDLRAFGLRARAAARYRHRGSSEFHHRLFRALQRREKISRRSDCRNPQDRLHKHSLRPHAPIPEINSPQPNLRNFAERTAMNTPMQGAAADLIKLAMIELDQRLDEGFKSHMILQVHDELFFEGPEKEIPRLRKLVKEVMEGVHELQRPARRGNKDRPKLARYE